MDAVISEVLHDVRALITTGWTRGRDRKMRGSRACYCIGGAIKQAVGDDNSRLQYDAGRMIRRAISPFEPDSFNIVDWNDAPGRTKAQVLKALDGAIKLAEAS